MFECCKQWVVRRRSRSEVAVHPSPALHVPIKGRYISRRALHNGATSGIASLQTRSFFLDDIFVGKLVCFSTDRHCLDLNREASFTFFFEHETYMDVALGPKTVQLDGRHIYLAHVPKID